MQGMVSILPTFVWRTNNVQDSQKSLKVHYSMKIHVQHLQELAKKLNVTPMSVSKHLHAMEKIQKEGK